MAIDEQLEFELTQYLDGELSGAKKRRLEARLDKDESLRREIARYGALEGKLAELASVDIAPQWTQFQREQIITSLERRSLLSPRPRRRLVFRPAFLSALGAAAAVVMAVVMFWPVSTGSRQIASEEAPESEIVISTIAPTVEPGEVENIMTFRRLNFGELHFSMPSSPLAREDTSMPPGTIVISVGEGLQEEFNLWQEL